MILRDAETGMELKSKCTKSDCAKKECRLMYDRDGCEFYAPDPRVEATMQRLADRSMTDDPARRANRIWDL